jgi:hypothetical protein
VFDLIPISFEPLKKRESFERISSTIAEGMSVLEALLSPKDRQPPQLHSAAS